MSLYCCGMRWKRCKAGATYQIPPSSCHEVSSILGCVISCSELEEQINQALQAVISSCKNVHFYYGSNLYGFSESNGGLKNDIIKSSLKTGERQLLGENDLKESEVRKLLQISDSTSRQGVICPFPKAVTGSLEAVLTFTCDELNKETEANLSFFEKQVTITLQRLVRIQDNGTPAATNQTALDKKLPADTAALLELCAELYDQDGGVLQKKVLKYLMKRMHAKTGFLLMFSPDTAELICQVIGDKIKEDPVRLCVENNMFTEIIQTRRTLSLVSFTEEQKAELLLLIGEANFELESFLCKPVVNRETDVVIALVCMVNKENGTFTEADEEIIGECFRYTASVLTSTIAFQTERRLKTQTEKMLEVAKNIFSRMDNLNELLREIMQEARNLTHSERCSVFLMDRETSELVAKVFDGLPTTSEKDEVIREKVTLDDGTEIEQPVEIRIPSTQGIAGHVATSGEMLNIKDAYSHPLFYRGVDEETGFRTRNILCFPIQDEKGNVVGVAQLCNKIKASHFTKFDEEIARAFSIYCCISIVHSLMYKKVEDAQQRSRLANELMTYHMQAGVNKVSEDNVDWLSACSIPPTKDYLNDYDLFSSIPREIHEKSTLLATVSMFEQLGFIQRWRLHRRTLARFVLMVKRGYRDPPYHNWTHAFSVAHFVYLCARNFPLDQQLTELELFALFVSSLCHDIDHRGTNNSFQVQSKSVLAALYSSEGSVLERHHFSQTCCILNTEGCNIFENLSKQEYSRVLDLMRDIILATDLAHHLGIMGDLKEMVQDYNATDPVHHNLLLCLLMTSADLSDQTKNWKNTRVVAELIYKEFFGQGDLEKALGQSPCEQMDRERACVPDLQISFLDGIALPLYGTLATLYPNCQCIIDTINRNKRNWREIKEHVNSGKIRGNTDEIFREKLVADDFDKDSA